MVKMPHWPIPYGKKPIDLGLERIKKLLNLLGNPHLALPPVIHVAGTNGKGSTIAYLKAAFEHAGYKVHRYISPHIVNFNERIYLAGQEISDAYLYELLEECRLKVGDIPVTFFEGSTAAAFLAFSRVPADVLLLEVGMGGRLDATNVIDNPLLSIITPVSEDHIEYLGNTIAQIAGEKAGIIKKGRPCVISWQYQEALAVLQQKCAAMQAPMYIYGRDWNLQVTNDAFAFIDAQHQYSLPKPKLAGAHQILNAATAFAALQIISANFNISLDDACYALENAHWPARLEHVTKGVLYELLPSGWEIWVDGAHNKHGAQMLTAQIDLWDDKPTYLINGRSRDRDIKGFLENFVGKVSTVCAVPVYSEPFSENQDKIYKVAQELGFIALNSDNLLDAVRAIIQSAAKPGRILVCGSLYLMSDVYSKYC